jgi:hypothetical protein
MHMVYKETDASYGGESNERHLEHYNKTDWQSAIGKTIIIRDNLDIGKVVDPHRDYNTSFEITIEYGDHERFKVPKETIYKIDKQNLYTNLTENEILASRRNDPFGTSMGSYTGHIGHEQQ